MRLVTDKGFEAFFRAEYRSLVALGAAMTGSTEAGQDLAQEAFARAFQQWVKVEALERPGAWVRRVLINLAIDNNRRRVRERTVLGRLSHDEVLISNDAGSDEWWCAVRALPDRQRAAVALYYLEDMSVLEVAWVLDVAAGTVKASLAKARVTLSNTLREVKAS